MKSNTNAYSLNCKISDLHMSQKEVAIELGVSQQYVDQIEKRALQNFKKKFCNLFPDSWELIQNDIERGHFGRYHWGY
jgi:transcriptional regulator